MSNLLLAFLVEPGPTLRRYIKEDTDFVPGKKIIDVLADLARIYSANHVGWCLRFADDRIPEHSRVHELEVPTSYGNSTIKIRTFAVEHSGMSEELKRAHKAYSDYFNPPDTDPVPEMIAHGVGVPPSQMPVFWDEAERYGYVSRVQKYDQRLTFTDVLARLPAPIKRCPVAEASPGYAVLKEITKE